MKKINVLWNVLKFFVLAIFNAGFFALGGPEGGSLNWISYVFMHLAFILAILTPLFVSKSINPKFFGASIFTIATNYFFVEFAIGLFFILLLPKMNENWVLVFLTQFVLMLLYLLIMVYNMIIAEKRKISTESSSTDIEVSDK